MCMRQKKILQITPHLGGGVGKAVIGAAMPNKQFNTEIVLLEKPEKKETVTRAREKGITVLICLPERELKEKIEEADIVIVNWWNHPRMVRFLVDFPDIPCRLVAWVHINGCTYPYLPFDFLDHFDYIFFTTKYSYENPFWNMEQCNKIRKKSAVVLGNGDFKPEEFPAKDDYSAHAPFAMGYAGTLNYSKIHKEYVKYCEQAVQRCGSMKVKLAGDPDDTLFSDIQSSSIGNLFELCGYVKEMEQFYLSLDVLAYICNEENYGTTENVILEAMACGIPVVAYRGGTERNLIDDRINGFLVSNKEEFAGCIAELIADEQLRREIGQAGRQKVCVEFSGEKNRTNMFYMLDAICEEDKKKHCFSDLIENQPLEWFLYFTGSDEKIFRDFLSNGCKQEMEELVRVKNIYRGERKSSVQHFCSYYPEDEGLRKLQDGIKGR